MQSFGNDTSNDSCRESPAHSGTELGLKPQTQVEHNILWAPPGSKMGVKHSSFYPILELISREDKQHIHSLSIIRMSIQGPDFSLINSVGAMQQGAESQRHRKALSSFQPRRTHNMGQELSETGRRRIQTVFPEYLSSLGSLGPSFMLHVITTQLCRSAFMHFVLAWGLKPCNNLPFSPPCYCTVSNWGGCRLCCN